METYYGTSPAATNVGGVLGDSNTVWNAYDTQRVGGTWNTGLVSNTPNPYHLELVQVQGAGGTRAHCRAAPLRGPTWISPTNGDAKGMEAGSDLDVLIAD